MDFEDYYYEEEEEQAPEDEEELELENSFYSAEDKKN